MNSTSVKGERVTSVRELLDALNDSQSITITDPATFVAFCADPATRYSVTFEMTIKPLSEEPSTSGSRPLTDGSGE